MRKVFLDILPKRGEVVYWANSVGCEVRISSF